MTYNLSYFFNSYLFIYLFIWQDLYYVAQVDLELAMWPRLASNSGSSSLSLPECWDYRYLILTANVTK
jgi:hypothetical protein